MNDIEQKALALVNEIEREDGENELTRRIMRVIIMDEALCRAIERHEAFRQEVSDIVYRALTSIAKGCAADAAGDLSRFIIPKPKPDPLIEVLRSVGGDDRDYCDYDIYVKEIRAALEARGLEIREKNDG